MYTIQAAAHRFSGRRSAALKLRSELITMPRGNGWENMRLIIVSEHRKNSS